MTPSPRRDHYSYTVYRDPATVRTFDDRRFGGPIGELVAGAQARVLRDFVGRLPGRRILDVGTGTGRAALLLARGGAHVTAVDASEEMLALARRRAAEERVDVRFVPGDAHALEFPDRSFEVVVSLRVLMHSPEWRTPIAEMCRVADQMLILDYPARCSAALLQAAARRFTHAVGMSTEPYRVFSYGEVECELGRRGFRIRSAHRQFVLPIAFHKAIGSRRFTLSVERALERARLLRVFGSPVTLVAERCASS